MTLQDRKRLQDAPAAGSIALVQGIENTGSELLEMLARHHTVYTTTASALDPSSTGDTLLYVFDLDLGDQAIVADLRQRFQTNTGIPRLFVLNTAARRDIVQAYNLGADDYLVRPLTHASVSAALAGLVNQVVERRWESLNPVQSAALKTSLKVIEDSLTCVKKGGSLPLEAIKESCDLVVRATAEHSLAEWMQAVRAHHNYTYRHSMMVCGLLVAFGRDIGIGGEELQRLTVGGMLHDIGKAFVPLELLDKPTRLEPHEWQVMQSHPQHACEFFSSELDLHPDIVDAAVHHHEKLDGTGYPDGLKGSEICDVARMVAVCDVYSGLTDKRAYKPAMSAEQAWTIMQSLDGHLDQALVAAFRPIAMGGQSAP